MSGEVSSRVEGVLERYVGVTLCNVCVLCGGVVEGGNQRVMRGGGGER